MISSRAETILKSIVEQYIDRATPVPSQSITNSGNIGVSSATVRNEMAYLEQEGYITRPHPSSGSIPLDKGYRYYVESLNDVELPLNEQRQISHLFHQVDREMEEWLTLAATLMAQLAQNVAVVTMPKPIGCQFKRLELVALQDLLALVLPVLHGAKVRQQLITFDRVMPQSQLTAITNKLNDTYSGLTSSQISAKGIGLSPIEQLVTDCLLRIMQTEDEQDYEEPYLSGWHFMLNQPEFAHSNRIQTLMELVEHRNLLKTIVPTGLPSYRVQVVIGTENKAEVIHDYSVVTNRYGLAQEAVGTISVIGPTRMPYARIISTVDYLASVMGRLVAELFGRPTTTVLTRHYVIDKE